MSPVRIALAGFGRFGTRHAQVVSAHPGALLVGVADPGADAERRVHTTHPDVPWFADAEVMLEETSPDALLVVSPEETHAAIVGEAFERGVHVLSEKPLATTLEDARRLVAMAEQRGVVYQAGYLLRYEPRHAVVHDHVRRGAFGDLATIRAKRNCSRSWFEDYGARIHPVYETLVHDIDLLVWLTGQRCQRVTAFQRSHIGGDVPDTVVAVLEFPSGTVATLDSSWLVPAGAPSNVVGWGEGGSEGDGVIDASLEIVGTRSSAVLTTYEPSLTIAGPTGTIMPETAFWPEVGGTIGGALREELWDFFARVQGQPWTGIASIEQALHVQEIADAITAAGTSGTPVSLGDG